MAFITLPGANMAAFELSVGFGSVPGTSTVSWTDISPYVLSLSTRRGRTRELDSFQTGTMTVVLNNSDRRFDPTYVSTPYGTTNLIPMVPVRLRGQSNSVTYDVWYGYATGWPQSYPDRSNHYAESAVQCVDGFEVLAATELPSSLYELVVRNDSPQYWWKFDEVAGSTTAPDSGLSGTPLPGVYTSGYDATAGDTSPVAGATGIVAYDDSRTCTSFLHGANIVKCGGAPITAYPFTIEAWVSCVSAASDGRYIWSQAPNAGQGTLALYIAYTGAGLLSNATGDRLLFDFTDGTNFIELQSTVPVATGAPVHVAVVCSDSSSQALYVNGVVSQTTLATSGTGKPTVVYPATFSGWGSSLLPAASGTFGLEGSLAQGAIYNTALTATQVLTHYQAGALGLPEKTDVRLGRILDYCGWSTSARSLDAGSTTVMAHSPSGTGLDYANVLAQTEYGGFYINQSGQMKWRARQSLITTSRYINSTATFSDAAGGLQYRDFTSQYDRTEIFNDVRTTRSGGVTQVAQSTSSITSFLRRTLQRSSLYMSDDNEALAASQYVLYTKNQPQYRVQKITVLPQSDPTNLWPQVLARELEDKVTVVRTPVATGAAITQTVRIQSVAHRVTPDLWETDFEMSPTTPTANWWIWNTSTWSASTTVNPAVWGY